MDRARARAQSGVGEALGAPQCPTERPNQTGFARNDTLISLGNMGCKVITKTMMERLRPFLDDFMSPLHASFIPKRRAADKVVGGTKGNNVDIETKKG